VVKKRKHREHREKEKEIATDEHRNTRMKKIFCCFNKKRICDGKGISVHQCESVANSSVLGWVLKKENENFVFFVSLYENKFFSC